MKPNVDITSLNSQALNHKLSRYSKTDTSKLDDKKLKEVCNDFESFFMQQLLDVSLKGTNVAGKGVGSDIIKGMYTEAISKNSAGAFGISEMLYSFLSKNKK